MMLLVSLLLATTANAVRFDTVDNHVVLYYNDTECGYPCGGIHDIVLDGQLVSGDISDFKVYVEVDARRTGNVKIQQSVFPQLDDIETVECESAEDAKNLCAAI